MPKINRNRQEPNSKDDMTEQKQEPQKATSLNSAVTHAEGGVVQRQETPRPGEAPLPELKLYCKGSPYGPLTAGLMRVVLDWENSDEYKERMKRDKPDEPSESFVFPTEALQSKGKGKPKLQVEEGQRLYKVLLKDHKGRQVVCHRNDNNRPFDESHCKKLVQEILYRRWAGPTTMPGETVNGEAIITSWPVDIPGYEDQGPKPIVINGQHTGCALILAWELWSDEDESVSRKWREFWPPEKYPDGPVIDKVVVTGVSPHARVVGTLDNVKPRSLADVIYTSDVFRDSPDSKKKEASRMLAAAIDFAWARVRAGGKQEGFLKKVYQTHSTSGDWLARHPRIIKCIEHLFELNRDRTFGQVKLSSGECAALMYIQASSTSDADDYYAQEEPSEATLNFDLWDKAAQFWAKVADNKEDDKRNPLDKEAAAIRKALANAIEPNMEDPEGYEVTIEQKAGTKRIAKMVVLSKAWALFKDDKPITLEEITPKYKTVDSTAVMSPDGTEAVESVPSRVVLEETSDFGGIDKGDVVGKETSGGIPRMTTEQKAESEARVDALKHRMAEEDVALKAMPKSPLEKYQEGKAKYGKERILLFMPKGNKRLMAYQEDADILADVCAAAITSGKGVRYTHQSINDVDELVKQLNNAGHQVTTIQEFSEAEEPRVAHHNPMRRKLPKPKPHNPSDV